VFESKVCGELLHGEQEMVGEGQGVGNLFFQLANYL
jgi:hypothetical protein